MASKKLRWARGNHTGNQLAAILARGAKKLSSGWARGLHFNCRKISTSNHANAILTCLITCTRVFGFFVMCVSNCCLFCCLLRTRISLSSNCLSSAMFNGLEVPEPISIYYQRKSATQKRVSVVNIWNFVTHYLTIQSTQLQAQHVKHNDLEPHIGLQYQYCTNLYSPLCGHEAMWRWCCPTGPGRNHPGGETANGHA